MTSKKFSWLIMTWMNNMETLADIVQAKVNGKFYPLAKVGRGVCHNKDLKPVE